MNSVNPRSLYLAALLSTLLAMTSACAVKGNAPAQPSAPVGSAEETSLSEPGNNDPLESINRGIFKFNEVIDGLILKPVAHIYRGVFPTPVRHGVSNALANILEPVTFLNSALQGDRDNMAHSFGRFLMNSTIGVLGVFDIASDMGIPKERKKDFGQTLGVWGVGSGPFIEIPIIGPSSPRDAFGMLVDLAADPFTYVFNTNIELGITATRFIDTRTKLLPLTDRIHRDSLDPYATIRSIYQQHRETMVKNYMGHNTDMDSDKKK